MEYFKEQEPGRRSRWNCCCYYYYYYYYYYYLL